MAWFPSLAGAPRVHTAVPAGFYKMLTSLASVIDRRIGLDRALLIAVTWYSLGSARRQAFIDALRAVFTRLRNMSTPVTQLMHAPVSLLPPTMRVVLAQARVAYAGATFAILKSSVRSTLSAFLNAMASKWPYA